MRNHRTTIADRLNSFGLSDEAVDVVLTATRFAVEQSFEAQTELTHQEDNSLFLAAGWAAIVEVLPNGKRSLIEFLLPGDRIEPFRPSIRCLCLAPVTTAKLPRSFTHDIIRHPRIAEALQAADDERRHFILQHRIRVTQMDATERLANLVCEMHFRLNRIGAVSNETFAFPLLQGQLGELLSVTSAHLCRRYKQLATEGLAQFTTHQKRFAILDLKSLAKRGRFVAPTPYAATTAQLATVA